MDRETPVAGTIPTPAAAPIVLQVERDAPAGKPDGSRGWLRWVTATAAVLAIFGAGKAWSVVEAHSTDGVRHMDPKAVVDGGGPAFRNDVRDATDAMIAATRALRRDLRKAKLSCHRIPGDGMDCTFVLPDGD